jgi:hypothetical protein
LGWIRECYNNPPLIVAENDLSIPTSKYSNDQKKKETKNKKPTNQPTILHNNIAIMHNMEEEFIKCFSFSKPC